MEKHLHPGMLLSRKCMVIEPTRMRNSDFLILLCVNRNDVLFFDGAFCGRLLIVDAQQLKCWLDNDEWTIE